MARSRARSTMVYFLFSLLSHFDSLIFRESFRHMFDILSVNLKEKVPTPTPMLDAARMEDVKLSDTEVLGKLTVNIQSASNLPKLDLLRPCDGYCVVWCVHFVHGEPVCVCACARVQCCVRLLVGNIYTKFRSCSSVTYRDLTYSVGYV